VNLILNLISFHLRYVFLKSLLRKVLIVDIKSEIIHENVERQSVKRTCANEDYVKNYVCSRAHFESGIYYLYKIYLILEISTYIFSHYSKITQINERERK
jgi:hypothetical protein